MFNARISRVKQSSASEKHYQNTQCLTCNYTNWYICNYFPLRLNQTAFNRFFSMQIWGFVPRNCSLLNIHRKRKAHTIRWSSLWRSRNPYIDFLCRYLLRMDKNEIFSGDKHSMHRFLLTQNSISHCWEVLGFHLLFFESIPFPKTRQILT